MIGQWWTVKLACGCKYDELRMQGRTGIHKVARHFSKRCKAHPKPKERLT